MGAQYFTARSAEFQDQVQTWLNTACAEIWNCTTATLKYDQGHSALEVSADSELRYVGTPSMHAPVKAILKGVPVITSCRIDIVRREQKRWTVVSETGETYTGFDYLVLSIPPVQAQHLLVQSGLTEHFTAQDSLLEPCWAVAVFTEATAHADAVFCQHPKLRFVSHQATKPGRYGCYILHFNAAFSRENLDQHEKFWFKQAIDILRLELGIEGRIEPVRAHRWLYASQHTALAATGIISIPGQQLWLGGDWSYGGRVENAYLGGLELARLVTNHCHQTSITA